MTFFIFEDILFLARGLLVTQQSYQISEKISIPEISGKESHPIQGIGYEMKEVQDAETRV